VIIGGSWLTGFGITKAEQLEITAAPGVIRVRQRTGQADYPPG